MERIQGNPRVAECECLSVSVPGSPKVVSLWVFVGCRRPRVSLMEWGLLGCKELLAIIGVLKAMMCIQCHVTPHGKLHGQI